MNLFNNWLIQAIIGNLVCYLLAKIFTYTFKKLFKSSSKHNKIYKMSGLKWFFYFGTFANFNIFISCLIFLPRTYLKIAAFTIYVWYTFFIVSAFRTSYSQNINKNIE